MLREIEWVQQNIRLQRWDPSEYSKKYGNRSAEEIIERGETNYLGPCIDLTTVLLYRLRTAGFDPVLVVQEVTSTRAKGPAFHLLLEVPVGNKTYTSDFYLLKKNLVYEGHFDSKKSGTEKETLALHRYSTKKFTATKTLFQFIGISSYRQIFRKFKFNTKTTMRKVFKAMKRSDTEKLHKRFVQVQPRIRRA